MQIELIVYFWRRIVEILVASQKFLEVADRQDKAIIFVTSFIVCFGVAAHLGARVSVVSGFADGARLGDCLSLIWVLIFSHF